MIPIAVLLFAAALAMAAAGWRILVVRSEAQSEIATQATIIDALRIDAIGGSNIKRRADCALKPVDGHLGKRPDEAGSIRRAA